MSRIIDVIRRVVQQEMARSRGSLLGVVTAVFPHEAEDDENNYEVNVRLKHEDLELIRVPVAVGCMGVAAPPKTGDLVLVQFLDADVNNPVITGRFYHDEERPPLHKENEILFEQRVQEDDTLNHFRFTPDGTIFLQRDVTNPEDNSEAKTSIKVEGGTGNIEIRAGEDIVININVDEKIRITCNGKPIEVACSDMTMTVDNNLDITCAKMTVEGDADINGDLKVSNGSNSTIISGNEIKGA